MKIIILLVAVAGTGVAWFTRIAPNISPEALALSPEEHAEVATAYTKQVLLGSVTAQIHRDPSLPEPRAKALSPEDVKTIEQIAQCVPQDFEAKYAGYSEEEIKAAFHQLRKDFTQVRGAAFQANFEAGDFEVMGVEPVGTLPPAEEFETGGRMVCFRQHNLGGGLIEHRRTILKESCFPELHSIRAEIHWLNARSSPVYRSEDLVAATGHE